MNYHEVIYQTVNYQILCDLIDYNCQNISDLLLFVDNLNLDNFEIWSTFVNTLLDSFYLIDFYIKLDHNYDQSLFLKIINLCKSNVILFISDDDNNNFNFVKISIDRKKKYKYVYSCNLKFGDNLMIDDNCCFDRIFKILESRIDMAMIGLPKYVNFIDDMYKKNIKSMITTNFYKKISKILDDFIAEFYTSGNYNVIQLLNKPVVTTNNYFSIFKSFDIKKSSISSCSKSITDRLTKKGINCDQLPSNSLLIDIVFEIENIPKFISNGNYIIKYDKLIGFHNWISGQIISNKINNSQITSEFIDRLLGVYLHTIDSKIGQIELTTKSVNSINTTSIIKPFTIIACHFQKKHDFINNIIKKNHINSIVKLSHTTIIVYSCDDNNWISNYIDNLKTELINYTNVKFIYDQTNSGLDFGKWSFAIKSYISEINTFDWIWLVNDSWFSCRDLSDFLTYYHNKHDAGLISLTDSTEQWYHLQSYCWLLNQKQVKLFENWNQITHTSYQKITQRSEIEFCQYLLSNNIPILSYYQTSSKSNDNIYANRTKLLKFVSDSHFPIVKLKFFILSVPNITLGLFNNKIKSVAFYKWLISLDQLPDGFDYNIYTHSINDYNIQPQDIKKHYFKNINRQLMLDYGQQCFYKCEYDYYKIINQIFNSNLIKELRNYVI